MQNSINIFHNDEKISTSYDNLFYRKENGKWIEIVNKDVLKGKDIPTDDIGENGDYYILYEPIENYIEYSEDFFSGWNNTNCIISPDLIKFPYTPCKKIIPTSIFGEHNLSYNFSNSQLLIKPYWCFSLYVMPAEFNYFELFLSNYSEDTGIKATFSRIFDVRKKIIINKNIEAFGDTSQIEYDDECFGIQLIGDGVYRIYLSAKFLKDFNLKCKFRLLKNSNGRILTEYSNSNESAGIFINAAQLTKTKKPVEYVYSYGTKSVYYKFKNVYIKELGSWNKLPDYINLFYGDDEPSIKFGQNEDIYFVNPFITINPRTRFGDNPLFRCWKWEDAPVEQNNLFYTSSAEPMSGDPIYQYDLNSGVMKDTNKKVYRYDPRTNSIDEKSIVYDAVAHIDYDLSTSNTYCWVINSRRYYTDRRDLVPGDYIYDDKNKTVINSVVKIFWKEELEEQVIDLTDWSYTISGDTVYVNRYRGSSLDITLPNIDEVELPDMTITFDQAIITNLIRWNYNDVRILNLNENGVIFHNRDKHTYSYICIKSNDVKEKNSNVVIGKIGDKIQLRIKNDHSVTDDESVSYREVFSVTINVGEYAGVNAYADINEVYTYDGIKIGTIDRKQYNILFNAKSLYNFDLINQAITYSTNLFAQTYSTRYASNPQELKFGYNSGGHGNFWDYNRLRRYY